MNRGSRNANVSYLLVDLTTFQKDLIEVLISLHAKSFEQELSPEDDRTETESNQNEKMYPQLSAKQMMYMFDSNFRAVANHPCLLVDHYMPRQLLRMEPSDNLVNTSDKFRKLQQVLGGFIERDRAQFPQVLKICLISHSVRELDLLEGLLLGKRVRIKRLSGTSLYDEKHVYFEESSSCKPDQYESKDATPSNDSGANRYTGYPRDDYDYSFKRQKRANMSNNDDWLFLTTTAHLINDPSLLDDYDVDFIVSFDPLLNPALPALEGLYQKVGKKIPIIKFLVADSPDHYILETAFQKETVQYVQLKKSINHFLRTRHLPRRNLCPIDYKQMVSALLGGEKVTGLLPDINLSPVETGGSPFQLKLSALKYSESELTIDEIVYDMKSYQSELMKRAVDRLVTVQTECKENASVLAEKRYRETQRQNRFDEMKAEIARKFKSCQDNEKLINNSEKRLERCRTEDDKLDQRLQSLRKTQVELSRLLNLTSESELSKATEEYTCRTGNLESELEDLEKVNEQKSLRNDELRNEYQQKSSLAAEQAQRLTILRKEFENLNKDAVGPAPDIQVQMLIAQEKSLQEELASLKGTTKFFKAYISKMNAKYDLKSISNGDGNSHNSSSSSSNGRPAGHGSRFRSTRSNTPTYT